MRRGTDHRQRVRGLGSVASILALMATTVPADNRDVGFGQSVTRGQQRFVLELAARAWLEKETGVDS
jgi:hypothetical protein